MKNRANAQPVLDANVLIIEDEPLMQGLLRRYIKSLESDPRFQKISEGQALRVEVRGSGWDLLKTDLSLIRVAIVDLLLPQITGADLIRDFHKRFDQMGFVAISGMATEPMKRSLDSVLKPHLKYLPKPLRKEDFFDAFIKAWNYRSVQQEPKQTLAPSLEEGGEELWSVANTDPNKVLSVHVERRGLLRKKAA